MGNLIAMVFQTQPSTFKYWCGSAIPFCLFSEGEASTLKGAQLSCEEISGASYPPELLDEDIYNVFRNYAKNHSISNVILNSMKRKGEWLWAKSGAEFIPMDNIVESDGMLVYRMDNHDPIFKLVCMADCNYLWKAFPNKRERVSNVVVFEKVTRGVPECKEMCEKNDKCSSINLVDDDLDTECEVLGFPYNGNLDFSEGSHHAIDRSTRTAAKCIGDYEEKKLMKERLLIIGIAASIVVLLILIVMLWKFFKSSSSSASSGSS